MNKFKTIMLAAVVFLPFAVSAQAADIDPPVAADPTMTGLYLRADAGWSFLEWNGGNDDDAFVAGGGIGYRWNDYFRTDMTIDWTGDYAVAPGAEISTTTLLGNAYLDWANDSMFTPYIGAGVGYGWVDGSGTATNDDGLALGLTAGVAVDLTSNISLDAGYRFREIMINGPDTKEHQATVGFRFSF